MQFLSEKYIKCIAFKIRFTDQEICHKQNIFFYGSIDLGRLKDHLCKHRGEGGGGGDRDEDKKDPPRKILKIVLNKNTMKPKTRVPFLILKLKLLDPPYEKRF